MTVISRNTKIHRQVMLRATLIEHYFPEMYEHNNKSSIDFLLVTKITSNNFNKVGICTSICDSFCEKISMEQDRYGATKQTWPPTVNSQIDRYRYTAIKSQTQVVIGIHFNRMLLSIIYTKY